MLAQLQGPLGLTTEFAGAHVPAQRGRGLGIPPGPQLRWGLGQGTLA